MADYKKIDEYFQGRMAKDGAGVSLRRCFGFYQIPDYDPFLLMDFFDSTDPNDYIKGFPWHPHRGIETITYLIHGKIEHEDSLGNKGTIEDGDCQWMSAGSGILHQEMPKASEKMLGVQIWLNLPRANKMSKPEYRDIKSSMIPKIDEDGVRVHLIAGEYKGRKGPVSDIDIKTEPIFLDVEIDENSEFTYEIKEELKTYGFVVEGEVSFEEDEERMLEKATGVRFKTKGEKIKVRTGDKKGRIFLLAGKPLNEEIAWGGPIVMNTKEELSLAFEEIDKGTFIKDTSVKL